MERRQQIFRVGKVVMLCALVAQLAAPALNWAVKLFSDPQVAAFLVYMETGRVVRPSAQPLPPSPTQPSVVQTEPPVSRVSFDTKDSQLIKISNFTGYKPDIGELLTSPLSWDLTGDGPAVLILHTHATESYAGTPGYRTEDAERNMLRVGREIARVLEENGIGVIHDRTVHDYPSYTDSYENARQTIQRHLREHPEICLVLDIHRDASDLSAPQFATQGTVDGLTSAQLMMVVGTDATGNYHPNWQENLALALKLSAVLEREDPGLTRPISLREHRFNMDLTPGSLIVEVGSAGNTLDEALLAARALAQGVLKLAGGA